MSAWTRPTWRPRTPCWPTRPRSTCRSPNGSASTSWPGSPRGTGSAWCSRPRPAPGSPRRSPCPARCSSWDPSRSARWSPPREPRPPGRADRCRVVGPTSPQPAQAPARPTSPLPPGPERVDAVDRAAFDRAAFDRAAFDRAGFGRTADGARVDRLGIDRAASDDAGPDLADDGADVRSLIPGPRMPLPSETGGLGPQEPAERVAPSWTGWWAGTDPARTGSAGADTRPDEADGDDRDVDRAGAAHQRRRAAGRRGVGGTPDPAQARAPGPPRPRVAHRHVGRRARRSRSAAGRGRGAVPLPGEPRGRPVGRRRAGGERGG